MTAPARPAPFTPVYRDGRSAASLIAELARGKPYGYVLTFEEIAGQLGIDPERPRTHPQCYRAGEGPAATRASARPLRPGPARAT